MRAITADRLVKRLSKSGKPIKVSVGGRRRNVLQVEPSQLPQLVAELRRRGTLAWAPYCVDCEGIVIEGSYIILRANTDYFVFPSEEIGIPAEDLLRVNVELVRGYRSKNGYVVVTGDSRAVKSVMRAVEHLLDNDVILLVHRPTEPCIRIA